MNIRGHSFQVDREQRKIAGVCAGIANQTGLDALIVRAAFVIAALLSHFTWVLIAYGVLAVIGTPRGAARREAAPGRVAAREEARERMRALDLRMQAIESYVTSSNSRLAREIEELR
jgi:phage shock protein C